MTGTFDRMQNNALLVSSSGPYRFHEHGFDVYGFVSRRTLSSDTPIRMRACIGTCIYRRRCLPTCIITDVYVSVAVHLHL